MIDNSDLMMFCCTAGVLLAVFSLASFVDGCTAQGILFLFMSFIAYLGGWVLDDD